MFLHFWSKVSRLALSTRVLNPSVESNESLILIYQTPDGDSYWQGWLGFAGMLSGCLATEVRPGG